MRSMSLVMLSSVAMAACAAADAAPADQEAQASETAAVVVKPAVTGTLHCNLEYERFSPFATSPIVSFSQPMSVVASTGVFVNGGGYQLYAVTNPTPPTNLSFQVGATSLTTGADLDYLVLPAPALGGAYLFEQGTRITPVTVGGTSFDHLRKYCSLTP